MSSSLQKHGQKIGFISSKTETKREDKGFLILTWPRRRDVRCNDHNQKKTITFFLLPTLISIYRIKLWYCYGLFSAAKPHCLLTFQARC